MSYKIPFFHFFTLLRNHKDFNLGLEEYFSLIEAIQKDEYYLSSAQNVLNLCRLLWLKPGQSENLFVTLFKQSFNHNYLNEEENNPSNQNIEDNDTNIEEDDIVDDNSGNNIEEDNEEEEDDNVNEDSFFYLNIINKRSGQSVQTQSEEELVEPYKISLTDHYELLKDRSLKQNWRSLQKTKDGPFNLRELDIDSCINSISEVGALVAPIYKRIKQNHFQLITLIDNQGSMIAFKGVSKTIAESAEKGGNVNNEIYYYRNLPEWDEEISDYYIYNSRAHASYTTLGDVLQKKLNKQIEIAILIISDAGSARRKLSLDRISRTVGFLQSIRQFTSKIAWLNPIPEDRWSGTSSSLIKDYIPMFEANETGLKEAVKILRGKIFFIPKSISSDSQNG